ncbi:MAG TPA: hypothetical protein VGF67_31200, partial [Ktedonobacteraceae bacterium]
MYFVCEYDRIHFTSIRVSRYYLSINPYTHITMHNLGVILVGNCLLYDKNRAEKESGVVGNRLLIVDD